MIFNNCMEEKLMHPFYYPFYNMKADTLIKVIESLSTKNESVQLGNFALPIELIQVIFNQINDPNLYKAAFVCRTFAVISKDLLKEKMAQLQIDHEKMIEEKTAPFNNWLFSDGIRYMVEGFNQD